MGNDARVNLLLATLDNSMTIGQFLLQHTIGTRKSKRARQALRKQQKEQTDLNEDQAEEVEEVDLENDNDNDAAKLEDD